MGHIGLVAMSVEHVGKGVPSAVGILSFNLICKD